MVAIQRIFFKIRDVIFSSSLFLFSARDTAFFRSYYYSHSIVFFISFFFSLIPPGAAMPHSGKHRYAASHRLFESTVIVIDKILKRIVLQQSKKSLMRSIQSFVQCSCSGLETRLLFSNHLNIVSKEPPI